MTNASYRKLTLGLLGVWLISSLAAAALNVYESDSDLVALPILAAAGGPIAIFVLWYTISPGFRRFMASLSPRTLTLAQTWRINGFVFLVMSAFGALPALFALPAGLGDMAVGATAPWIASRLGRHDRRGFLLWHVLGILDLVMAVTLGATARLISPAGPAMSAMTVLPLSLIPTFFVPLLFILHLISIAQALHGPAPEYFSAERLPSSAL